MHVVAVEPSKNRYCPCGALTATACSMPPPCSSRTESSDRMPKGKRRFRLRRWLQEICCEMLALLLELASATCTTEVQQCSRLCALQNGNRHRHVCAAQAHTYTRSALYFHVALQSPDAYSKLPQLVRPKMLAVLQFVQRSGAAVICHFGNPPADQRTPAMVDRVFSISQEGPLPPLCLDYDACAYGYTQY